MAQLGLEPWQTEFTPYPVYENVEPVAETSPQWHETVIRQAFLLLNVTTVCLCFI
jgi:hypothetical protein